MPLRYLLCGHTCPRESVLTHSRHAFLRPQMHSISQRTGNTRHPVRISQELFLLGVADERQLYQRGRLAVNKLWTSSGSLAEINERFDALHEGRTIRHIVRM